MATRVPVNRRDDSRVAPGSPSGGVGRARGVARLLDDLIRIPGTNIGIGLDPIIGLIPGIGDVVGGAMSGYILLVAAQEGAPTSVLVRMLGNIAIDSLVGIVPVLGDLFDVAFKANARNAALLDGWLVRSGQAEPGAVTPVRLAPSRRGAIVLVLGGVLLIALVGGALAWMLLSWVNRNVSF